MDNSVISTGILVITYTFCRTGGAMTEKNSRVPEVSMKFPLAGTDRYISQAHFKIIYIFPPDILP